MGKLGVALATLGVVALSVVAIAAVQGRKEGEALQRVAPRAAMTYGALLELGPEIQRTSGATIGEAREVVYLVACSGLMVGAENVKAASRAAAAMVRARGLAERQAVEFVLSMKGKDVAAQALIGC